jgi:integrase
VEGREAIITSEQGESVVIDVVGWSSCEAELESVKMMGSPKTMSSRRSVPLPEALKLVLLRLRKQAATPEELVFHTSKGTPTAIPNCCTGNLKPAGRKLGRPWLNWHSLRRTDATYFWPEVRCGMLCLT